MRVDCDPVSFTPGHFGIVTAVGALVLAGFLTIGFAPPAKALPSFARQTGQPCGACHTDFPTLTPYGRRFKLLGYTTGGGKYQTTLFPDSDDSGTKKEYVPPIAMMTIIGYTHTEAPQPPPTAPFSANDNVALSSFTGIWGGAITDNIGAFSEFTYSAPPAGGFSDPYGHNWSWDNTDVRYANSTAIGNTDVVFGITANNNPTVQDVWNTTPAWVFPYNSSPFASTPAAATIIDGAFAQHVGGAGAYLYIDDMVYLEASAYRTLGFGAQNVLGVDPFSAPGQFGGVAPYWRAAFEPHWGNNSLMVGTFGMLTDVHPWSDPTFGGMTGTFSQTDKYSDLGFDSQYQYQGPNYWLTLSSSYIHEYQKLDASFANGLSANPTDELNTLRLLSSLAYGGDNRVVLTGQYFNTWGTSDTTLYSGLASGNSPNSSGWIAEIAYIPFGVSMAPGWPWFNARIGLDYIAYTKFDGTSVGASSNNTLFLSFWMAM
jgi:hypothetical protein